MTRLRSFSIVVFGVLFVVGLGAALVFATRSASSNLGGGQPNSFTVGTAILVVGYLVFPVLALIAAILLLVAVLLVVAHLIESRREGGRGSTSPEAAGDR